MDDVIARLDAVIAQRLRDSSASESYVASLQRAGLDKILKKLGEECTETVMAGKDMEHDGDPGALVRETADLWFHSLLLLARFGLGGEDVLRELERRFDVSGLVEKASRGPVEAEKPAR